MLATATAYRGASSLKDKELCRVFPVLGHPAPLPDTLKPKPDTLNRISCWGVPVFRAACRPCSPRSPCSPSFSSYVFFFVHVGLVSVCSARIFKDVVSPGMCRCRWLRLVFGYVSPRFFLVLPGWCWRIPWGLQKFVYSPHLSFYRISLSLSECRFPTSFRLLSYIIASRVFPFSSPGPGARVWCFQCNLLLYFLYFVTMIT